MDAESQSLWDEQQQLIADVQERAGSFGALAIYGAAISVLSDIIVISAKTFMRRKRPK
jgi:hypothetical protein